MPVQRDRALLEHLMDLERTVSLRGAGWTFHQVVEQFEREFALHQWRRHQRQEGDVRRYWSYGQLRRTHACRNLPEVLRREAAANRTSVAIRVESTVPSELIICNRFFEARSRSRVSLVLLSPFSRRHARLRQYRERRWNADWGMAWRSVTSRTGDNRVHVRQRSPSQ